MPSHEELFGNDEKLDEAFPEIDPRFSAAIEDGSIGDLLAILADDDPDSPFTLLAEIMGIPKRRRPYRSTPISTLLEPGQKRRSKSQIDALRAILYETVEEYRPMTVRQVFYQMVSKGAIGKTEQEYKGTVGRLLVEMRKSGELPYSWIADNTRWMRKPHSYGSVDLMLKNAAASYRRAFWDTQPVYVEIWLEKEALAGVLVDATAQWDVPLMVTRGYSSVTFLHSAAESIADQAKPAYLYYFGDHDPSGVDITRNVDQTLRELAPEAEIHFQKVAVTAAQIVELNLPTRPTKTSDSRSRNFEGESVEVDAISPPELRQLCESVIVEHVDQAAYEKMCQIEKLERQSLQRLADSFGKST